MFIYNTLVDWYTLVAEFAAAHIWVLWVLVVARTAKALVAAVNAHRYPWNREARHAAVIRSASVAGAVLMLVLASHNPAWLATFWLIITGLALMVIAGCALFVGSSWILDQRSYRRRASARRAAI